MYIGTYTTILHVLSVVSLVLALVGIYCVLKVRVKAMSPTYRRLLFMYLVLSLLAELSHTIFFTPVILAPLLAGYNEGILSFLPPVLQYTLWLGFSVGSAMVMELQFHFRFNTLLSTYNPLYLSMNSLRRLHFLFIFYVLLTAFQVYFSFSDSPVIRFELSKKYPALREELLLPHTIAISPEFSHYASFFYYYSTTSIALHGVLIIAMITYCYMKLASGTSTLSTATKKTARYYLKCLILQFSVHSTVLYGPFVLMFYIQYMFQILNRDITNVGMICVSLHGSCSILTMLVVMTNYRDRIVRVFTCKGALPEKWTITRNSKLTSKVAFISVRNGQ